MRRGMLVAALAAMAVGGCKGEDSKSKPGTSPPGPVTKPPATKPPVAKPPPPPKSRRIFTSALENDAAFMAYSKQVGAERFCKFVIDVKSGKIFYFDVKTFPVHRDFVFGGLYRTKMTREKEAKFRKNYGREKPSFILGYLVHHLGPDIWTMAFWSGDLIVNADIVRTYKKVKATFYLGARLKYRPDSHYQEFHAKKLQGVDIITNDKIYKDAAYQMFNKGSAVGVLRIVKAGAKYEDLTFNREDVVVLPEALPDITPVSGIISDTFSTPLSHVSLRARAWGIPNVGLKKATTTYKKLHGKTVFFEAGPVKHVLREASPAEIAAWKARRAKAKKVVVPKADLHTGALRQLVDLRAKDVVAYGAKTANLGEVARATIKHVVVPAGFGIPIRYYAEHMKRHGLDKRVTALLADKAFRTSARLRKNKLAALRAEIAKAPLAPEFRTRYLERVAQLAKAKGVFVRSSTNAEDLPGFNGAGLYDTVPNVKGADKLVAAVKQVWASVWNLRAYEERELFGIDHTKVFGAVLVQVAVNPTAAGVLITPPPKAKGLGLVYIINAKSGLGMRVVAGKKSPEIVHYNHYNKALRIMSRSDETTQLVFDEVGGIKEVPITNAGKPVLTDPMARKLGGAAAKIVELFPKDRALDIEWLIVGDELNIVQARPYIGGN